MEQETPSQKVPPQQKLKNFWSSFRGQDWKTKFKKFIGGGGQNT